MVAWSRRRPDGDNRSAVPCPDTEGLDERTALLIHLGLGPDAAWSEIDEAYHKLISDTTPGPGSGLDRRVRRLAERFLAEVEAAYAELRRLSPEAKAAAGGDDIGVEVTG